MNVFRMSKAFPERAMKAARFCMLFESVAIFIIGTVPVFSVMPVLILHCTLASMTTYDPSIVFSLDLDT